MNDFLQSLRNGQAEKPRTPKTRKNYDNSYSHSSGPRFHNYGNSFQQPRNASMNRPPTPGASPQAAGNQVTEEQNLAMLTDVIDNLVNQVDALVKNQEYMITVQERTADLLQRQADAMEMVMAHFNINPEMPAPNFENHYTSSQEPEEELDGTVEELLKAEMEAELRRKTAKSVEKPMVRKRRKVVSQPPAAKKAAVPARAKDGNTRLMGRDEIMDIINTMRGEGATYDEVAKRLIDLGQPTFSGRGEWHAQTIHRLCSRK